MTTATTKTRAAASVAAPPNETETNPHSQKRLAIAAADAVVRPRQSEIIMRQAPLAAASGRGQQGRMQLIKNRASTLPPSDARFIVIVIYSECGNLPVFQ